MTTLGHLGPGAPNKTARSTAEIQPGDALRETQHKADSFTL